MNTPTESKRQSQRLLLGFGLELADSLHRYASWRLSIDPELHEKAKLLIERDYLQWFRSWPHRDHVCFADITFFSPDQTTVADALTILFTPEFSRDHSRHREYVRILSDEYIRRGQGHTMAPHAVFSAGLPMCTGIRSPETGTELKEFFAEVHAYDRQFEVESGYLWGRLRKCGRGRVHVPRIRTVDRGATYIASDLKTYASDIDVKSEFTATFATRVSAIPIKDQFDRWLEVWNDHAHEFKSGHDLPMEHVLAVPVGFRDPDSPEKYTAVACVFLGIDGGVRPDELREIVRFVYLHILESNATAWLLRKGALIGRDAAIVPASHELLRVIAAIRPGLSDSAFGLLRRYFKMLLMPRDRDPATQDELLAALNDDGTYSLKKLLELASAPASRVQELVLIAESKSADVANISAHELDALLTGAESSVNAATEIDSLTLDARVLCSSEQAYYLFLALMGALRNAIRHSRRKGGARYRIQVVQGNPARLLIENEFCDEYHQSQEAGEPTGGTLKALRAYVRGYGMDPRLVSLKRIIANSSADPVLTKREVWQTSLPIPGDVLP